ncbi:MAG TPA: conjugal transfer protein [Actinomycetota bacterium]
MQPAPALPSPATDPTLPRLNGLPISPDHPVVLDEGGGRLGDSLRAWKVKMATVGLWVLVALAGAGGLRALVWSGSPAAGSAPAAAPAAVAGFAEMYVAAYLEAGAGQEQALHPYYPAAVDLHDVIPRSRYAARTAAVASSEPSPGYWAITVGAEVLVAAQGGYVGAGTHFYRVGVMSATGPLVATSLPAEVPAPTPTAVPPLRFGHLAPPSGDAPSAAVEQFFDAYLAGHGEPGAGLRAVTPPPFTSVAVTGIAMTPSGQSGVQTVQAEVLGTDAGGLKTVLDYSFQLTERNGAWVVTSLLAAAPLGQVTR